MSMSSYDIGEIAPESGTAWKPEVGDGIRGTIVWIGDSIRDNFDKTAQERSLRIDLDTGTGTMSVYPVICNDIAIDPATGKPKGYPNRLAKAVAAAVRAAGATQLAVGGTLAVKRVEDAPTKASPAKDFRAKYEPPVAGVSVDFDDTPAPTVSSPHPGNATPASTEADPW